MVFWKSLMTKLEIFKRERKKGEKEGSKREKRM